MSYIVIYLYDSQNQYLMEHLELEREYKFNFDNLDYPIKARIMKIVSGGARAAYQWEISHYYKKSDQALVYIPTAPYGDSFEEAEIKLLHYVEDFERATGIEINKNF